MKLRQIIQVVTVQVPDEMPDEQIGESMFPILMGQLDIVSVEVLEMQDENGERV